MAIVFVILRSKKVLEIPADSRQVRACLLVHAQLSYVRSHTSSVGCLACYVSCSVALMRRFGHYKQTHAALTLRWFRFELHDSHARWRGTELTTAPRWVYCPMWAHITANNCACASRWNELFRNHCDSSFILLNNKCIPDFGNKLIELLPQFKCTSVHSWPMKSASLSVYSSISFRFHFDDFASVFWLLWRYVASLLIS